jgi:AraC-like DNA-binding protein
MADERHHVTAFATGVAGLTAMSLVSNRAFPRHSHDQYGIGLICAGGHRSWSGAGRVDAVTGDIITVNPGEMHDGAPLGSASRAWHMLYFDPGLIREIFDGEYTSAELARPALDDPLLRRLMGRLFQHLAAAPDDSLALEEHCQALLGAAFSRHGSRRPSASHSIPNAIARVRQRLDDAPHASATLGELAAMAGLSRYQLLRSFARTLGTTPHAYLLQRRVLMARSLIADGHSLSQAALAAGFSDQSHMSRVFTRQLGLPPGRYRRALFPA